MKNSFTFLLLVAASSSSVVTAIPLEPRQAELSLPRPRPTRDLQPVPSPITQVSFVTGTYTRWQPSIPGPTPEARTIAGTFVQWTSRRDKTTTITTSSRGSTGGIVTFTPPLEPTRTTPTAPGPTKPTPPSSPPSLPTSRYEPCDATRFGNIFCEEGFICIADPFIGDEHVVGRGICVKPYYCGGLGGFQCPEEGMLCVDDPRDDCDPNTGWSDCIGLCV